MSASKAALFAAVIALAACSSNAPAVDSASTVDDMRPGARTPAPTRSMDHPTGATESSGRGSLSGGDMTAPAEPDKEKQRGNTPPGTDRDGHGPAAGAIVDPTGAATQRKPF